MTLLQKGIVLGIGAGHRHS